MGDNGSGSTTTHTYASLSYTTKTVDTDWHDTNISAAYGPPDDTAVKVLDKVTYADGSSTKFEYNGYLQVKKISNLSAETTPRVLNAVETNLSAPPSDAEDCPRLSETGTTVENFNGGSPVVVKNTLTTGQTFSPPDLSPISATRIQVWVEGHPDNLRSNTFVAASGWKEGLPVGTEDCITTSADCTTRKRWTWSEWTQDNTGVSYIVNPRVNEHRAVTGERAFDEYSRTLSGLVRGRESVVRHRFLLNDFFLDKRLSCMVFLSEIVASLFPVTLTTTKTPEEFSHVPFFCPRSFFLGYILVVLINYSADLLCPGSPTPCCVCGCKRGRRCVGRLVENDNFLGNCEFTGDCLGLGHGHEEREKSTALRSGRDQAW